MTMSDLTLQIESVLCVDVGAVSTRAALFNLVDGQYRFMGSGVSPTTAGAPFHDVSEGVRSAIDELAGNTGWRILDENSRLILPAKSDLLGVDAFAATISAGPPLKIVAVGLLDDVSLESAVHLAETTYCGSLQKFGLNENQSLQDDINAIIRFQPDVVLVAGGTDGGAEHTILKRLDSVGIACFLMPQDSKPEVLYVGNRAVQDEVKSSLGAITRVRFAPNVRPMLDVEQLDGGVVQLAEQYRSIRTRQIPGVHELDDWAGGGLKPTAVAFGRVVRFLSKLQKTSKGVLGIDVGASATTVAAAYAGDVVLNVNTRLGLGVGLGSLLEDASLREIINWLPVEISETTIQEYLANKALYPASIPSSVEELFLEQAVARVIISHAYREVSERALFRKLVRSSYFSFEPILASGSVLTRAPKLAQTALILLDGIQPTAATTMVLDQHHLIPSLGVAAAVKPDLAIQVLDSHAFVHLGTVISPMGNAPANTDVMQLKIAYEDGREETLEVKQGTIQVLRLPRGQSARLQIHPYHRYDVGMGGPGHGGKLKVHGGTLGLVIDARGRPLRLPSDPARRREIQQKWLQSLGG